METNITRPAPELTNLNASALQATRFKERRTREVESDVKSTAVYYSPVIRIDTETASAVIQYRDEKTGEVQREYPHTEAGIQTYKQVQGSAPEEAEVEVAEVSDEDDAEPVKADAPQPEHVDEAA